MQISCSVFKKTKRKTLVQVDINIFPLWQHLKTICDLLPTLACTCLSPFNNLLDNKWFDIRIPSQNAYTIIPFPTYFLRNYLMFVKPNYYHILVLGQMFSLQPNQSFQTIDYLLQSF